MGALDDARAHLAKAREFLEAAEATLEIGLFNAATSSAVIAGINAKDAICLKVTGRTGKSDRHAAAIAELASAGTTGKQLAPTFRRLLKLKGGSQYLAASVGASDAVRAVAWATKMVEGAQRTMPAGR